MAHASADGRKNRPAGRCRFAPVERPMAKSEIHRAGRGLRRGPDADLRDRRLGRRGQGAAAVLRAHVDPDLGIAYVVDSSTWRPTTPASWRKSSADTTEMPVLQVEDSPELEPNCVYVIAPDRELVIEGNTHSLATLHRAARTAGADRHVLPLGRRWPAATALRWC